MLGLLVGWLLLPHLIFSIPADYSQNGQASLVPAASGEALSSQGRKLTGNFLHISDIHPDPFFKAGSDPDEACHHSKGTAGPLGAEKTECDSPISLVNATFQWINDNLRDQVDFVVWTGDSARHDNDERIPRNKSQVLSQNRLLIEKFREVWGAEGREGKNGEFVIPIVPTLGNNDILPHNILRPGPNQWMQEYLQIWRRLVPEAQRHSFTRGGWYFVEVIPDKLAVFSLNTMYFFNNNAAVDGCDDTSEPGYEQFEWLRIQLELMRQRGVKAILTGHVPPARNDEKEMWTESCWMKYALWVKQYRDVIVGSLYGHMNVEHFFLQDFNDIVWDTETEQLLDSDDSEEHDEASSNKEPADFTPTELRRRSDPTFETEVKPPSYLNALREQWSALPSAPSASPTSKTKKKKGRKSATDRYHEAIGGQHAERYAVSFVSASVVPNFYPTLRVFSYNTSGLEEAVVGTAKDMDAQEPRRRMIETEVVSAPQPTLLGKLHKVVASLLGSTNTAFTNPLTPPAPQNRIPTSAFRHQFQAQEWNDIETALPLSELASTRSTSPTITKKKKKHHKKKKPKPRKPRFAVPKPPPADAAPGPAYHQQSLSWLGYTQLYANLSAIQVNATKEGKGLGEFKFEVEYDTRDESDVYGLDEHGEHGGITVRGVLELAGRIGQYKPKAEDLMEDDLQGESEEHDRDEGSEPDSDDLEAEGHSDGEDESDDNGEETIAKKKKGKKGKKHKQKKDRKRRKIINKSWFAFVDRALVGTVPAEELHRDYGQVED